MLKKVVFPAPFGPMIETIERGAMLNETSSTATRPPKILLMSFAVSSSPPPFGLPFAASAD